MSLEIVFAKVSTTTWTRCHARTSVNVAVSGQEVFSSKSFLAIWAHIFSCFGLVRDLAMSFQCAIASEGCSTICTSDVFGHPGQGLSILVCTGNRCSVRTVKREESRTKPRLDLCNFLIAQKRSENEASDVESGVALPKTYLL